MSGSEADFNLRSELAKIRKYSSRRKAFLQYLEKRFCAENFECWCALYEFLQEIRSAALIDVHARNKQYFKLVRTYVDTDGPSCVSFTPGVKERTSRMTVALFSDQYHFFDTRLLLELQKEVEMLLHSDVLTFVLANPMDALDEAMQEHRSGLEEQFAVTVSPVEQADVHRKKAKSKRLFGTLKGNSGNKLKLQLCTLSDTTLKIYEKATLPCALLYTIPIGSVIKLQAITKDVAFRFGSNEYPDMIYHVRGKSMDVINEWVTKMLQLTYELERRIQMRDQHRKKILGASIGPHAPRKPSDRLAAIGSGQRDMKSFLKMQEKRQQEEERLRGPKLPLGTSPSELSDDLQMRVIGDPSSSTEDEDTTSSSDLEEFDLGDDAYGDVPQNAYGADAYGADAYGAEILSNPYGGVIDDIDINDVKPDGGYGGTLQLDDDSGGGADAYGGAPLQLDSSDADAYGAEPLQLDSSDDAQDAYGGGYGGGALQLSDEAAVDAGSYGGPLDLGNDDDQGGYGGVVEFGNDDDEEIHAGYGKGSGPDPYGVDSDIDQIKPKSTPVLKKKKKSKKEKKKKQKYTRFDWSKRFQSLLEALNDNSDSARSQEKVLEDLIHLGEDFVRSAKRYGKIIISEMYKPQEQKTIRPVSLGGIIGGEKFIVGNILFKFAVDVAGVFGKNHHYAAKVAGHELKGLKAYFQVGLKGLHFPLMALIDYKGFRLIAISLLPLGKSSLIYGSNDAGRTIYRENDKLNSLIEIASKQLNLKPHDAGIANKRMYSPVDLEGHIGTDGKFYLLDYSRTMPPVTPKKGGPRGAHLFQMFRPEFLKTWRFYPLCSDAYSHFVSTQDDCDEHKHEVDEATKDLLGPTVSNFAQDLVHEIDEELDVSASLSDFSLPETLHAHGINVRYLGNVVCRLGKHKYQKVLIVHMCARIIKVELRARLRAAMENLKLSIDEPYRMVATEYLNLIFSDTPESKEYWQTGITKELDNKFGLRPQNWKGFPKAPFKDYVFEDMDVTILIDCKLMLFEQVRAQTGLKFRPSLLELLRKYPDIYNQKKLFDNTDVVDLGVKVKHLDVISNAKGRTLTMRGIDKERAGYFPAARHSYEQALEAFRASLASNPLDVTLLRNCAQALVKIETLNQAIPAGKTNIADIGLSDRAPAIIRANNYYVRAIQADPNNPQSHSLYAKFLERIGNIPQAEDHYLKSLMINPNYIKGLMSYANFLTNSTKEVDMASMFYERAVEVSRYETEHGKKGKGKSRK